MIDVTYLLAKSGKKILLANKESLVIFGSVIMDEAQINNTKIIPIDSELFYIPLSKVLKSIILKRSSLWHLVALFMELRWKMPYKNL